MQFGMSKSCHTLPLQCERLVSGFQTNGRQCGVYLKAIIKPSVHVGGTRNEASIGLSFQ